MTIDTTGASTIEKRIVQTLLFDRRRVGSKIPSSQSVSSAKRKATRTMRGKRPRTKTNSTTIFIVRRKPLLKICFKNFKYESRNLTKSVRREFTRQTIKSTGQVHWSSVNRRRC
ncbi:hypothetical protein QLX08_007221 [Tetragonisca angustula]|uniref:Uncharacterized protein n=1 Tax=Tetragonisca angustula TaxID=166442 RepID=A0AAW0ZS96_9HYME